MRSSSSSSEIARARISFCDKLSKSLNGNVSYSRGYCRADRGASCCQRDSPRPSVREELLFVLLPYLPPTLPLAGWEIGSRRSRSSRRQQDHPLPGLSA